jgi:hypothetical protein
VNPARRHYRGRQSIVLIVAIGMALVVAGLIGTEFYARHHAASVVADAVQCEIRDSAEVSFGAMPPVLWQYLTGRYTEISVHSAGHQVREANQMTVEFAVRHVRLRHTDSARGTIGALAGTISWPSDGIKQSVQDALPVLGGVLTSEVTTDPGAGTVELTGPMDRLTVKPQIVDGGLSLKVVDLSLRGHALSRDDAQQALDHLTSKATKNYPLGIHGDSVQVTDSGVAAQFSASDTTIPSDSSQNPCLAML